MAGQNFLLKTWQRCGGSLRVFGCHFFSNIPILAILISDIPAVALEVVKDDRKWNF